jgi:uncharacterized damage-inducible protein DinB
LARIPTLRRITVPARAKSREAASFLAQLDEMSGRMIEDMRGASAAELAWQSAPGHNTEGMLLAHIAVVEVFWLLLAQGKWDEAALRRILGVGADDDGMPLRAGGRPPAALRGRSLAWYRRLLVRARAFTARSLRRMGPRDLDRLVERRRDGKRVYRVNVRWILYHVLEHQAGHYGQLLLLRHQYRDRRRARR